MSMSELDVSGKVTVWDVGANAYKKVYPIDAREQLHRGTALWKAPEEAQSPRPDATTTPPASISAGPTGTHPNAQVTPGTPVAVVAPAPMPPANVEQAQPLPAAPAMAEALPDPAPAAVVTDTPVAANPAPVAQPTPGPVSTPPGNDTPAEGTVSG